MEVLENVKYDGKKEIKAIRNWNKDIILKL